MFSDPSQCWAFTRNIHRISCMRRPLLLSCAAYAADRFFRLRASSGAFLVQLTCRMGMVIRWSFQTYEVCSKSNGNFNVFRKSFIYSSTSMLYPPQNNPPLIVYIYASASSNPQNSFWNLIFGIAFSSFSCALLISSMLVLRRHRKKSHWDLILEFQMLGSPARDNII